MKYMKAIILKEPLEVKALIEGYTKKGYKFDMEALMVYCNQEDIYFYIPDTYLRLLDNVKFNSIWIMGLDEGRIRDSIRKDAIIRTMIRRGIVHIDDEVLCHVVLDNHNDNP